MLDELKAQITAAVTKRNKGYVTAPLARVGLYVGCMKK
jgi:hypothetical protein